MKVVFLGSADFGLPALEMLLEKHTVVGIVSTPPRKKGRGLKEVHSPVIEFAQNSARSAAIPCLMPDSFKDASFLDELSSLHADCFVVVAFRILPRAVFSLPEHGTVNIHASLLPRYRGPAPIHRAIEAGETATGVTVFRIDDGIDTGEILLQQQVSIGEHETTPQLYSRLSLLGSDTLEQALHLIDTRSARALSQNDMPSCSAPKLRKEEARINWNLSAVELFNKIRAFKPFPGTFTMYTSKRLGIDWAVAQPEVSSAMAPGTICSIGDTFFDVQTGSGVLRIYSVKPEGRNCMPVHDFLNGTTLREGQCFFEQ